jgi:hypothetical protein
MAHLAHLTVVEARIQNGHKTWILNVMKLKDIYLIFGTVCWLVSLTSILFNRPRYLKIFSLFIFISISVEWACWYMARKLHVNNLWLYNIYTLIEFIFLAYFYSLVIRSEKVKNSIKYFLFFYPLIFLGNCFFIQGLYTFNTYSYLSGLAFLLFLIIVYFREILLSADKIILTREPLFYIGIAFFLFFVIEIPYTILLPYFVKYDLDVAMALIWVIKILNIVLYVLLTIAYLCRPKTQK